MTDSEPELRVKHLFEEYVKAEIAGYKAQVAGQAGYIRCLLDEIRTLKGACMRKEIGYAVVGSNGLLWQDSCEGVTKNQYRIYNDPTTASKHLVEPDDVVVQVLIQDASE